jgi:hypothetical protein
MNDSPPGTRDFHPGDKVIYRDRYTALAEYGRVTSTNEKYVFVKFNHCHGNTSQACEPSHLEHDR